MSDQEPPTEGSAEAKFVKLMAKFLQENGFPPSIIDSRSFKVLMETIAQCGPNYEFPSQEELSGPLTEEVMNWVAEWRKKHERAWEWHGCTLMVDSWTHPGRHLHLLTFMVGSVEGIFFLGSADASYATDHADLLAELIEERIDEVGRDKVVQVVTDNSHNLKAACKILQPVRLAGSYRCWFVKKYCWLVCVREKYCSAWKFTIVYDKPVQTNRLMILQSISTIILATITAVVFQITILMLHVTVATTKQSKILYSRVPSTRINNTKNTRLIQRLGSATVKGFNTHSTSSPTTASERESFVQIGFQERGYAYLGRASQITQNRSPV